MKVVNEALTSLDLAFNEIRVWALIFLKSSFSQDQCSEIRVSHCNFVNRMKGHLPLLKH